MDKVQVIFRKDKSGEVMAFFPEMRCNYGMIICYQHIGQHSEASMTYYNCTKKATATEYLPLFNELSNIYSDCNLIVRNRLPKGGNRKAWN